MSKLCFNLFKLCLERPEYIVSHNNVDICLYCFHFFLLFFFTRVMYVLELALMGFVDEEEGVVCLIDFLYYTYMRFYLQI